MNTSGSTIQFSKPIELDEQDNPVDFKAVAIASGVIFTYPSGTVVGDYLDAQISAQDWSNLE